MDQNLVIPIKSIAYQMVKDINDPNITDDTVLHLILSESIQAVDFVCSIEDHFNIEFDDDEVDIDFFRSFEAIASLVKKHLVHDNV